ncbi:hypothetical protein F2Q69_00047372 [Brassica cretica]|uniref:Uncharacterized protein n=1 Tax=Brassica cretica TaxID=69181 RepID=A0A8S9Q0L6_BRACR|nr:hypothetical protein F2Q69_00047372 [Brassica cretica]
MKQEQVCSSPEGGNCEDGLKTARSFQLGHPPNWPSWSRVRSSSAIRRTGLIQIGRCRADEKSTMKKLDVLKRT